MPFGERALRLMAQCPFKSLDLKGGEHMKKIAIGAAATIIGLFTAQAVMAQTATPSPTVTQTTTPTPTDSVTVPTEAPATGRGGN